jgi:hypothetical protein
MSSQRCAPAALYPWWKDPWYPLDRRLGGPQSRLDAGARRKILCPCLGSNPDRPARSQKLYCLSYRGSTRKGKSRDQIRRTRRMLQNSYLLNFGQVVLPEVLCGKAHWLHKNSTFRSNIWYFPFNEFTILFVPKLDDRILGWLFVLGEINS